MKECVNLQKPGFQLVVFEESDIFTNQKCLLNSHINLENVFNTSRLSSNVVRDASDILANGNELSRISCSHTVCGILTKTRAKICLKNIGSVNKIRLCGIIAAILHVLFFFPKLAICHFEGMLVDYFIVSVIQFCTGVNNSI